MTKNICLVGGGHTHALVLRQFFATRPINCQITLISDVSKAAYSGMVPGHLAGHYEMADFHIDLANLTKHLGATFIHEAATAIDPEHRLIVTASGRTISYDCASINIGSQPNLSGLQLASDRLVMVKPLPAFLDRWHQFIHSAELGQAKDLVVIGGGAGGIELSLAAAFRLPKGSRVTLLHRGRRLFKSHSPRVQGTCMKVLRRNGVDVQLTSAAQKITGRQLTTKDGRTFEADLFILASHAATPTDLEVHHGKRDKRGFLTTHQTMELLGHQGIFGVGDGASNVGSPHPKNGVNAVRQAPVLAYNLKAFLAGKPLKSFEPQKQALMILAEGPKRALGIYRNKTFEGAWVWYAKDWIDRKFVRQFRL